MNENLASENEQESVCHINEHLLWSEKRTSIM